MLLLAAHAPTTPSKTAVNIVKFPKFPNVKKRGQKGR